MNSTDNTSKIFDIVFEGGGAKGLVQIGAMMAFDELGFKQGRLIGTSAGAMTAALTAAGFSPKELLAASSEKLPDCRPVFASFMDVPKSFSSEVIV